MGQARQAADGGAGAPLKAHRRAVREQLAHLDALRSELEAEGMATELLDGEQVARLLWARFNPTKADNARRRAQSGVEVLGELDAPTDRDLARQAAIRLRAADRAVEPRLQSLAPACGHRSRRGADDPRRTTRPGARRWDGCTGRC